MTEILSMGLFEQRGRLLVTRRKDGQPPFAGDWVLPAGEVHADESAEEALERHAHHELGVEPGDLEFGETLYVEDAGSGTRYVVNIFRVLTHEGELRVRVAGEYDDARWLTTDELSDVAMPRQLREWLQAGRHKAAASAPVALPSGGPAPDNRASWNKISRAYQDRYQLPADELTYGPRCPGEDELGLVGDVSGLRVIVLGCGGGQDCIVLAKQGAQVIGIDLSDRQIEYGRRLAQREGVMPALLQGNVEELKEIEDESQDLALSLHALNYVERTDRAFAEAFRVLRGGSPFVLSVHHPFYACTEGGPPYSVVKGYWEEEQDWQWEFSEKDVTAKFRSWYRPVSVWLEQLREAGFEIDRVLEPAPVEEGLSTWDGSYDREKMRLMPNTLIIRVVKP